MYVHKLIEDLQKNLRYNRGAQYYNEIFGMENVIQTIQDSEVYYFDDMDKIMQLTHKNGDFNLNDLGDTLRPPFGNILLEGYHVTNANVREKFCLLLLHKGKYYEMKIFYINDDMDRQAWVSAIFKAIICLDPVVAEDKQFDEYLGIKYQGTNVYALIHKHATKMNNITPDDYFGSPLFNHVQEITAIYLMVLESMLRIIMCKNIIVEVVSPSKMINRKRKRKNKPLVQPYNIFKVVRNGTVTKAGNLTGETRELTHCPGHFKTYTEDNPLFGKHVGTWWWSPWIKEGYKDQYRERRVEVKD